MRYESGLRYQKTQYHVLAKILLRVDTSPKPVWMDQQYSKTGVITHLFDRSPVPLFRKKCCGKV